MLSGSTFSTHSNFLTLPVKPTLLFIVSFGLLLAHSRECVANSLRSNVPVDVELDSNGTLTGEVRSVDGLAPGARRVSGFRGSHLVAEAPMATDGGFRLGGLDGGIYWVATPGTGQSVRAWATGTAPPASQHRLVLVHDVVTPVSSVTQQAVVVAQLPYSPMTNYAVQPVPAYPFQPYQVPGGGMVFPGYYTSPGAAFFGPLVTTAVVTAVSGVIVVTMDDDDDDNRAASP